MAKDGIAGVTSLLLLDLGFGLLLWWLRLHLRLYLGLNLRFRLRLVLLRRILLFLLLDCWLYNWGRIWTNFGFNDFLLRS